MAKKNKGHPIQRASFPGRIGAHRLVSLVSAITFLMWHITRTVFERLSPALFSVFPLLYLFVGAGEKS